MSEKRAIDWESIEREYRAGILSVREIAASQGITHGAINKRAKRDSWDRDLNARIQAKADALVSKREVSASVSSEDLATERQIVEANAEAIARVRLAHRTDISKARALSLQLLAELEFQTGHQELFSQLQELMQPEAEEDAPKASKDRAYKLREAFEKAMSLGGRTKTMKDLADTLKTLIALEREAYGLGQVVIEPDALDFNSTEVKVEGARRIAFALARANAMQTVH